MATQDITQPQDNSQIVATTATATHPQTPTNAPFIGAPEANPAETEASEDEFFTVSDLPGRRVLKKQTPSPSKKTKPTETSSQALPRDLNVVPSSDLIKDYVAYADRWENPAIMHEFMIIAGIAALVNGKVWIKNGGLRLPLDFWVVLLSMSGSGRNTLVNEFRDVMTAAGLSSRIKQEAWGSASYIEEYFSEDSTGLFIWPEMSQVLNQFKQRHYAGAQEWITNLYDEKTPPSSKHYRTSAKEENQTPAIDGRRGDSHTESPSDFLDFRRLAAKLGTSEQWVRRNVRRTYTRDPIPHLRFGRLIRFVWDSQEMSEWIERHKATQSATKSNVAELRPASYNGKRTEHDDTERRRK
jgi:predicted DNA-binding transcriptional regulator AlpA